MCFKIISSFPQSQSEDKYFCIAYFTNPLIPKHIQKSELFVHLVHLIIYVAAEIP